MHQPLHLIPHINLRNILFQVKDSTDSIVLNCLDLNIGKAVIKYSGHDPEEPISKKLSNDLETLTLKFSRFLPVGKAQLCLSFSGEITDKMKGLYRSKYTR